MWKPRKCAAYLVISKNLLHVYSSAVVSGSSSFSPVKISGNHQGQTSTVRLIKTSIKGHRTSLVCRVSFHQNNIVKIFPQPPCWIRSTEYKQRSRKKFSCNFAFRKKGKKQNKTLTWLGLFIYSGPKEYLLLSHLFPFYQHEGPWKTSYQGTQNFN